MSHKAKYRKILWRSEIELQPSNISIIETYNRCRNCLFFVTRNPICVHATFIPANLVFSKPFEIQSYLAYFIFNSRPTDYYLTLIFRIRFCYVVSLCKKRKKKEDKVVYSLGHLDCSFCVCLSVIHEIETIRCDKRRMEAQAHNRHLLTRKKKGQKRIEKK